VGGAGLGFITGLVLAGSLVIAEAESDWSDLKLT